MSIQQIPTLPEQVANFLQLPSLDALRKSLKRWSIVKGRFDRTQPLSKEQLKSLAQQYAETGSEATKEQASQLLDQLIADFESAGQQPKAALGSDPTDYQPHESDSAADVQYALRNIGLDSSTTVDRTAISLVRAEKVDSRKSDLDEATGQAPIQSGQSAHESDSPVRTHWTEYAKDVLLSVVALVAMCVQIVNTATVVQSAEVASSTLNIFHAWAYAFAIQFTGLALTLYKGNLVYLRIFAFAEFCVNLLYFKPWVKGGLESWTTGLLLSGLIAFAVYSYVEIFAARRTHKTDGHE